MNITLSSCLTSCCFAVSFTSPFLLFRLQSLALQSTSHILFWVIWSCPVTLWIYCVFRTPKCSSPATYSLSKSHERVPASTQSLKPVIFDHPGNPLSLMSHQQNLGTRDLSPSVLVPLSLEVLCKASQDPLLEMGCSPKPPPNPPSLKPPSSRKPALMHQYSPAAMPTPGQPRRHPRDTDLT